MILNLNNELKKEMGLIYTSTITILTCVFIGGTLTTLYGKYCGIDPFDYNTWWRGFTLHGSPLCKFLNTVSYYSHYILENLYLYVIMILFSKINSWLPFNIFKFRRKSNRSASI